MSLEQKLCEIIKKNLSKEKNVKNELSAAQYNDLQEEFKHLISGSMGRSDRNVVVRLQMEEENYEPLLSDREELVLSFMKVLGVFITIFTFVGIYLS